MALFKDSPKPPDPMKTAQAQAQLNKETALTQAQLNMVNQVTPQGTLTYQETGKTSDGTPQFTATQTLSPEEQGIFDLGQQTRQNVGQIGVNQSAAIRDLLSTPVDLSNDATESRLLELGRQRLNPILQQQQSALETQLFNQGVRPGTEAYRRAMEQFQQGRNDAYNQLILGGHNQAVQEALTQRNQPINEITALLSGSQVSQPNYVNTPNTPVSGVDYAGLVNQNYQNQLNAQNGFMGGLFGAAGTALGGWARGGFALPALAL